MAAVAAPAPEIMTFSDESEQQGKLLGGGRGVTCKCNTAMWECIGIRCCCCRTGMTNCECKVQLCCAEWNCCVTKPDTPAK